MNISKDDAVADRRLAALQAWASRTEAVAGSRPEPASGDASFRRYFRLRSGGTSLIAMDAPPEQEDCLPFMRIAGYLEAMQLNAPRIVEADIDEGFLLLTDLGTRQYLDELRACPGRAGELYADALAALHTLQHRGAVFQQLLPPYDEKLLRFELSLFHDWLCESHLDLAFGDEDEAAWRHCCDLLVANALDQPQAFVHRDYHSRNLMVMEVGNPGILDFQDAVEGPLTYDLVSLLKDCYVRWPAEQVIAWAEAFYSGLDDDLRARIDRPQFLRYFELMGVQRHLKAAGIFARLWLRDGKPGYLADVPRTLSYIVDLGPRYAELGFLVRWIEERVLPGLAEAS